MKSSDWDPLPPNEFGLHPGERVDLAKVDHPPASVPSRPKSEAEKHLIADEIEAQNRALDELQQRMAAAPKRASLVGEIEERVLKQERRQRASSNAPSQALSELAVTSSVTAADLPLPVAYAKGANGRDPREDESWFRELPKTEQQRLHQCWALERQRERTVRRWSPRRAGRAVLHGGTITLVMAVLLLFVGASMQKVCILAVLGAVASGVAQVIGGGRFMYSAVGLLVFFLVFAADIFVYPFMIVGGLLMSYGFGALGMEEEMRMAGGFDAQLAPRRRPDPR